ncbi:hypothetical protein [Botrimarina mediterranea]|uniref:Uncharacterized protein n=1 Tax=Botrimarina mediterranea TaxID=2528022 RepID=A0A518K5K9_9BACT|nr:hypothetical protein [Botrimarina mediterranea]QDV73083.1 hypothetical protein Spa11_12720 [Botrimarina mediterranea]
MEDELRYSGVWHFNADTLHSLDDSLQKIADEMSLAERDDAEAEVIETFRKQGVEVPTGELLEQKKSEKIEEWQAYSSRRFAKSVSISFTDDSTLAFNCFGEAMSDVEVSSRTPESFHVKLSRGQRSFQFRLHSWGSKLDDAVIEAGPGSLPTARAFRDMCRKSLNSSRVNAWRVWLRKTHPLAPLLVLSTVFVCAFWNEYVRNSPTRAAAERNVADIEKLVEGGIDSAEEFKAIELLLRREAGVYDLVDVPKPKDWQLIYPLIAAACAVTLAYCLVAMTPKTTIAIGKGEAELEHNEQVFSIAKWIAITVVGTGIVLPLARQLIFM